MTTAFVGQAISRVDGPLKVSGRATYAYETWDVGQPLYGVIVGATIGKGRIASIDTARVERLRGVRLVLTHENAPPQGMPDPKVPSQYSRAHPTLASADVQYYGQPIALVVADTFEQARDAAQLVDAQYVTEPGLFDFSATQNPTYAPARINAGLKTDTDVGDFESAFAAAAVKIDQRYTTPYQFSQPMEPNCCLATWEGDDLTAYLSSQIVGEARTAIASTLGIDAQRIHLFSPYVGGGFGSKLGIHGETILAAMAARAVKQPVKVAVMRQQIMSMVSNRPATDQRIRLGADADGRLVAIGHEVTMSSHPTLEYAEQTAATGRGLYAAAHRMTRHRMMRVNVSPGEDMRAPGDAPGLAALEQAMDDLAYQIGIDPIALRVLNEPSVHPESGLPFSDRHLVECMREGATRFGWERRPKQPATLRDGQWLVGYGMAAAIRAQFQAQTKVTVRLGSDGIAVVRSDMTDIGTGTYTIVTQVAADALGLPLDRVRVELGHSDYPPGAGSGGSFGASNTCTAVHRACMALREKMKAAGTGAVDIEAEGEVVSMEDDPNFKAYDIAAYGAQFAEVGVDADTGEIRLRRMLGVFAPGRILNAKTARSQLIGGMIFGVGFALHEEALVDVRTGAFVNRDLGEYLVPVNADIPEIDAVVLEGFDGKANELGIKGIGELGHCGANAAVANAVFNATGVRVRDFPITIEKVLSGLPAQVM